MFTAGLGLTGSELRFKQNPAVVRCRTVYLIILTRIIRRLQRRLETLRSRGTIIGLAALLIVALVGYFGVSLFWPVATPGLANSVEMAVDGLEQNRSTGQIMLVLKEKAGGRRLAMAVGQAEARSIATELQGARPDVPFTHDVMRDMLQRLGARVSYVLVDGVSGGTYSAKITVVSEGREFQVSSRPSDAIALALRTHSSIYAEPSVLDRPSAS